MEASGNSSDEQGQTKKRRRSFRRRLRSRWVLRAILTLAPFATKVVELVIVIIRALK
jgi:hypothetical protein